MEVSDLTAFDVIRGLEAAAAGRVVIRNRVPTHIRPTDEDTRKRRMDQGRTAPSRLRLTEALHLQVGDIDPHRRLVHVQRGKGMRDRYVPLTAIEVLQA